jgi:hypothetical protein
MQTSTSYETAYETAIALIDALRAWIDRDIDLSSEGKDILPERLVSYRQVALAAFDISHGATRVANFVAGCDALCESEHESVSGGQLVELLDLLPKW